MADGGGEEVGAAVGADVDGVADVDGADPVGRDGELDEHAAVDDAEDGVAFLDAGAVLRVDHRDAAGDQGGEGHLGEVGLELNDLGVALLGGGAGEGEGGGGLGDGLGGSVGIGVGANSGGVGGLLALEDDLGAAPLGQGLDDRGLRGAGLGAGGVELLAELAIVELARTWPLVTTSPSLTARLALALVEGAMTSADLSGVRAT